MIYRIIFLFLMLVQTIANGQHLPLYSAQNDQIGVVNPAAINHNQFIYGHRLSLGASFHKQWIHLENGPTTQFISGSYLYHGGGNSGLIYGGHLINDATGPTSFTGAYGRVAAMISSDPDYAGISLGIHGGLVQYRIALSDIELRDRNDILIGNDQNQLYPDFGAGIFFWQQLPSGFLSDAHIYAGVSVPQILGLDLGFESIDGKFSLKRLQHFYGTAGVYIPLRNDRFIRLSNWTIYAPGVPIRADFNVRYMVNENFWIGTGGSTAGAIQAETGFITFPSGGYDKRINIGYLYEYSFNTFGPDAGSSHQIQLLYLLD